MMLPILSNYHFEELSSKLSSFATGRWWSSAWDASMMFQSIQILEQWSKISMWIQGYPTFECDQKKVKYACITDVGVHWCALWLLQSLFSAYWKCLGTKHQTTFSVSRESKSHCLRKPEYDKPRAWNYIWSFCCSTWENIMPYIHTHTHIYIYIL